MMIIVDDVGTQGTRYPFQGPRELRQLMDVFFGAIWYPLHRAFGYPNLPVLDDDLPVII